MATVRSILEFIRPHTPGADCHPPEEGARPLNETGICPTCQYVMALSLQKCLRCHDKQLVSLDVIFRQQRQHTQRLEAELKNLRPPAPASGVHGFDPEMLRRMRTPKS